MTVPTVGQNSDTSAAADLMTVVGDVDDVAHFDDFIRGEVRRGDRDVEFPDRPLIGISDQKTKQFLWDREIVGPKMEGMHSPTRPHASVISAPPWPRRTLSGSFL